MNALSKVSKSEQMHVLVTREFLELVENNVLSQCLACRVDAARVDTHCDFGLLMSDHSLFANVFPLLYTNLFDLWRFCTKLPVSFQVVKDVAPAYLLRSSIKSELEILWICLLISQQIEYNPLDLFSGSKERILKAIKGLFTTPRNNSYVFLNGSLILGGLRDVAKNTDCIVCSELGEEQAKRYTAMHSASLDESLRIVTDYLIAVTAKDCSLMLCFRPRNEDDSGSVYNNVYLESTKQSFDVKLNFIKHFLGGGFVKHMQLTSPTFSCAMSNMLPAMTFVMAVLCRQAKVIEMYKSHQLSLTSLVCFIGTLQAIVVTFVVEHNPFVWRIGWDMNLLLLML
ncbi:hypothetical protein RJT34_12334 [Clitoria ternatea]|uniref:Inositol-pentakisphosphate 2-kinase n=1 Tax=Clitoria ternatea TaxID=43366 RepID=A0AAN9JNM6_CLITE